MVKWKLAAAASVVSMVAFLAGTSNAAKETIGKPTVIHLRAYGCLTNDDDPATRCHVHRLTDERSDRTGEISRFRTPIFDLEGNDVGREYRSCVYSQGTESICTTVLVLRASSTTGRGRIALSGVPGHPLPIIGGSGAYLGVEGSGRAEPDHGSWLVTLNLIP